MSRAEAAKWFGEVVPELAKLVLRLPFLLEAHYQNAEETGLRLLESQEPGMVVLSQVCWDLGCIFKYAMARLELSK